MREKIQRKPSGDILFDIGNNVLVFIVITICAYPIYYTLIASISDPMDVIAGKVTLFPRKMTWESYASILKYQLVWTGYRNTIFYTSFGLLWNLFLLIPASYAMAKKGLKGKNLIMVFFVFTMYFGGGTIPYYLLLKNMNMIDNPLVLIIPGAFSVYNMIITRTFFASNFPESLGEAAKIDGAGEFRIFVQIALPLSGAIIAVMALYHAVGHWNSYFSALLFINDSKLFPLQLVLRQVLIMNQEITIDTGGMSTEEMADLLRRKRLAETMKYSLIIVANLPILAAYPFVQKYFVKGVMIGSVKG